MPLILQHVVVTILALGALGVIVRRVVGTVRPAPGASACSTCAAGTAAQVRRPPTSGVRPSAASAPGARQESGTRYPTAGFVGD